MVSNISLPESRNDTPLLTLVWIKRHRQGLDAQRIVKNMLRSSCGPYGATATVGGDERLAWGMLLPDIPGALTCWSIYQNGHEVCLIEGDLYDDIPGLRIVPGDNPEFAHRIAIQLRKAPDRRIRDVFGIYSGVYINQDRSCGYAFGDMTGTRLLYWLSDTERFVVSGNLWAFRGCSGLAKSWDKMALSQLLTIGYPLAGRTWISGVRQLQRGRQVRSFANGRTEVRMLLDPVNRQLWSLSTSVRALRDSLDETVLRICQRVKSPVSLGLSGGIDSRTLLASLHSQHIDHWNITSCIDSEEPDNRVAKSLAQLLGVKHDTIVFNAPNPISHVEYRLINEGESPGFGFLLLAAYAQKYSKVLLLGSEAVREGATFFRPTAVKNKRDLGRHLLREHSRFFSLQQLSDILSPDYRVALADLVDEWYESFDEIDQSSIFDVYLDHLTDYRIQRRTRPRLEAARWYCLPVYPFMDEHVYNVYRSVPIRDLGGERTPIALLCDYNNGSEKLSSAAFRFNLSLQREYQYRCPIQLGHVLREMLSPWYRRIQEVRGRLGLGSSILNSKHDTELRNLEHCEIFNKSGVRRILEKARSGTFVNRDAINRMINAEILNEFLFGRGFTGDRSLTFFGYPKEIRFLHSVGNIKQTDSNRSHALEA